MFQMASLAMDTPVISRSIIQQFVLAPDFHCHSKIADMQFSWTGTVLTFCLNTEILCITSVNFSLLHQ